MVISGKDECKFVIQIGQDWKSDSCYRGRKGEPGVDCRTLIGSKLLNTCIYLNAMHCGRTRYVFANSSDFCLQSTSRTQKKTPSDLMQWITMLIPTETCFQDRPEDFICQIEVCIYAVIHRELILLYYSIWLLWICMLGTPGFKSRIRPPYPQHVVKGD